MPRTLTLAAFAALCTLALTCKKEPPVVPPNGGPDTTSHNFRFETFVLGDGNSSILYDVQVVDDNNVWAVGEVFFRDSVGQYSEPAYNVIRWDGASWSYQRLVFPKYNFDCTIAFHLASATTAVFAFAENNILISDGGSIARWDGISFVHYRCLAQSLRNGTIRRIWGVSESQFYVVGLEGTVIRYNSGSWQKLESGTSLHVQDIRGSTVGGETEILAVASRAIGGPDRRVLQISESNVQSISDSGIVPEPLSGIWFSARRKYYVVGSGIYRKDSLGSSRWTGAPLELTEFYSADVDANDTNDVVVVGAFGDMLHYNGASWRQYADLRFNGSLLRVSIRGNTLASVGYVNNHAIAVIGRRQ